MTWLADLLGYKDILVNGALLVRRSRLNLIGAVTGADDPVNGQTNVTFSSSGSGDEEAIAELQADVVALEASVAANASSITALTTALAAAQRGWAGKRTFTAADSAQLADAGKLLYSNVAAAHDFTLQPNSSVAFGALDVVSVLQKGAGPFTVKGGAGVTPVPPPGKTLTSKGIGAMVSMTPDPANLNIWNVTGDLA